MSVHLQLEAAILVGEDKHVVDDHHGFQRALTLAFEEGEPFTLLLQLHIVLAPSLTRSTSSSVGHPPSS